MFLLYFGPSISSLDPLRSCRAAPPFPPATLPSLSLPAFAGLLAALAARVGSRKPRCQHTRYAAGRRSPIGHTNMRPGVDRRQPHHCRPLPAGRAAIPAHGCATTPLRSPAGGGSDRRAAGEEKGGPTSMRSSARPQRAYILMPPCHLGSAGHYPLSKLWRC